MKKYIFIALLLLSGCNSEVDSSVEDCDDPLIKGNLTTYNGEKIYHVPGGQFYDITDAEEMFCAEGDAEAAGFRRSER